MTVVSFPRRSETVVLLHSSASSNRQWDTIGAALSPASTVYAPSLLGYDSRAPWPLERAVTLDDEATALEPLLDAAPRVSPPAVLTCSWRRATRCSSR